MIGGIVVSAVVLDMALISLVVLGAVMAFKATRAQTSKFRFDDAFLDENGKTSMGRVAVFVALAASTWGFVALVQEGKLTEWYMTAYIGAFVVNGIGSKAVGLLKKEPAP